MRYAAGIAKHWKANWRSVLSGCDSEIRVVITDPNDNGLSFYWDENRVLRIKNVGV